MIAQYLSILIQGNYVLGTYGVIIIWALILGAIVWSVSVGRFTGPLTGTHATFRMECENILL